LTDGYSVSYIISGEEKIFFHLSSNKECPLTDTDRFGKRITKALGDIKLLFEKFNNEQKLKNGAKN
jgi:carnitine O-palmitoyltransferase 1